MNIYIRKTRSDSCQCNQRIENSYVDYIDVAFQEKIRLSELLEEIIFEIV